MQSDVIRPSFRSSCGSGRRGLVDLQEAKEAVVGRVNNVPELPPQCVSVRLEIIDLLRPKGPCICRPVATPLQMHGPWEVGKEMRSGRTHTAARLTPTSQASHRAHLSLEV